MKRRAAWIVLAVACLALKLPEARAQAGLDYALQPLRVAADTYVFVGRREDFSVANGGNIVNTAFVVTDAGVVVIDSGPTRRYGEAMRREIAKVTAQPIVEVWITHHHPDHFLGNQAFAEAPIAALPATAEGLRAEGAAFADNIYRLTGDWAKGTEALPATRTLAPGERALGEHRFRLLALQGHTAGDLAILDETTGVLFAGDLVFHARAPTTPHAELGAWLAALDRLEALPFRVLVPGHGEPTPDATPIRQTRAWLVWLKRTLGEAASAGLDPAEILERPLPPEFAAMPLARRELARSLAHLYRGLEARALQPAAER